MTRRWLFAGIVVWLLGLAQSAFAGGTVLSLQDGGNGGVGSKILVEYDLSEPVRTGMQVRLGFRDPQSGRLEWKGSGLVLEPKMVNGRGNALVQILSADPNVEPGWKAAFVVGTILPTPTRPAEAGTPAEPPTLPPTEQGTPEMATVEDSQASSSARKIRFPANQIQGDPGLGSIFLDGALPAEATLDEVLQIGRPPVEILSVPEGQHVLKLALEGYEDTTMRITVEKDKRTRVNLGLPASEPSPTPLAFSEPVSIATEPPLPTPTSPPPTIPPTPYIPRDYSASGPPAELWIPALHSIPKKKHSCLGWLRIREDGMSFEPDVKAPEAALGLDAGPQAATGPADAGKFELGAGALTPPPPPAVEIRGGEFSIKLASDVHVFSTPFTKRNADFWDFVLAGRLPQGMQKLIPAKALEQARTTANAASSARQQKLQRWGGLGTWGVQENLIVLDPHKFAIVQDTRGCPFQDQFCFSPDPGNPLGPPSAADISIFMTGSVQEREVQKTASGANLYILPKSLEPGQRLMLQETYPDGTVVRFHWSNAPSATPDWVQLK